MVGGSIGLLPERSRKVPLLRLTYLASGMEISQLLLSYGAAKESNLPSGGLLRPAGFEDRMGHQTPAAPRAMLERQPTRVWLRQGERIH